MSAVSGKTNKIVRPSHPRLSGPKKARRTQGEGASAPSPDLTAVIRLLGRSLDDVEHARIQTENRIGALGRALGLERITRESIPPEILAPFEALDRADAEATKALERAWRRHSLAPWSRNLMGVGDKTIARLIAEIGDPLVRTLGQWEGENDERRWIITGEEPRTLAQLFAYCGHGDPVRRKRKNMAQEDALGLGNPRAKRRVWLIASTAIKARCSACRSAARERKEADEDQSYLAPARGCTCAETHPLRHAYDQARAKYASRLDADGNLWTPGHQHAAALRYVGKTFLRLLYEAAQDARPSSSRPDGANRPAPRTEEAS
jgi:hypothetical protein